MDLKPHGGSCEERRPLGKNVEALEASDISVGTDTERAPTTGTAFQQDSLMVSIET